MSLLILLRLTEEWHSSKRSILYLHFQLVFYIGATFLSAACTQHQQAQKEATPLPLPPPPAGVGDPGSSASLWAHRGTRCSLPLCAEHSRIDTGPTIEANCTIGSLSLSNDACSCKRCLAIAAHASQALGQDYKHVKVEQSTIAWTPSFNKLI